MAKEASSMRLDWRVVDPTTGLVDREAWDARKAARFGVGHCQCGAIVNATTAELLGGRIVLGTECPACGHEALVFADRPVRRPAAVA
jgi:hypothetical protein